jgi:hypothetical protein
MPAHTLTLLARSFAEVAAETTADSNSRRYNWSGGR